MQAHGFKQVESHLPTSPSLTVIISTYNDLALVEKKLAEIQAQTAFASTEFIFVETGSPQRERDALQPFTNQHDNCRLHTTEDRHTLFAAWNMGWDMAQAPWVCYSNMDDTMHPRLCEILQLEIAQHDWDICSTLIAKQDAAGSDVNTWQPRRLASLKLSPRPGPFTAWRKSLAQDFGYFDARMKTSADKDFWARAQARQLNMGMINQLLYLYTKSPAQLSKQGINSDDALLAEKDYPCVWPGYYRRQSFWRRAQRKLAPASLVPATE